MKSCGNRSGLRRTAYDGAVLNAVEFGQVMPSNTLWPRMKWMFWAMASMGNDVTLRAPLFDIRQIVRCGVDFIDDVLDGFGQARLDVVDVINFSKVPGGLAQLAAGIVDRRQPALIDRPALDGLVLVEAGDFKNQGGFAQLGECAGERDSRAGNCVPCRHRRREWQSREKHS